MKNSVMVAVTSLLAALLFLIHWADDVVRGLDTVKPNNVGGFLILAVWLFGPLVLPERRSGLVIAFLSGIFAVGVAALHLNGSSVASAEFPKSIGAFRFILTLYALGAAGTFTMILAARGLWNLRSGQPAK
jgi:hypothetical protein